jgi:hypothetical protein
MLAIVKIDGGTPVMMIACEGFDIARDDRLR